MKKFIVEHTIPGGAKLSRAELKAIAVKSCLVMGEMDLPSYWVNTFVTNSKLYCIHIAPDFETVQEHAQQSGFPIDLISEVTTVMDPTNSV